MYGSQDLGGSNGYRIGSSGHITALINHATQTDSICAESDFLKSGATAPPRESSGVLEKGGAMTSGTLRSRMTTCVLSTTLVVLLFCFALFAQANFGRILGAVTDPTGAVLPGARVSILDTQRAPARTVTTDEAGQYNAPALMPGRWTFRGGCRGLQALGRRNVVAG